MIMAFDKLIKEVTKIKCDERRVVTEDTCEVVIPTEELAKLDKALKDYFGKPLKPAGEVASSQAQKYSQPFGGVYSNQTMYFRMTETGCELALLWPWSCGTAVTVKIVRQ